MTNSIQIKYQDDHLLILDKPSGVVVNRASTHELETVQDYMEKNGYLSAVDKDAESEEFLARSGVVHRLDKDTSGVLVVAKTPEAFKALQGQFKNRTIKKEYRALVLGKVTQNLFEVDAPVGRNPKNRLSMAIIKEGKSAKTRFQLLKNISKDGLDFSYLAAFPVTGRTHQIRVHLAALNFPIVLDSIYCTRKQYETLSLTFTRMMLHALSIEFTHPVTGELIKVDATLPEDFTNYL